MATATHRTKSASRKSSRGQSMNLGSVSTKRRSGRRTATKTTVRRAKTVAKPKRRMATKRRRSPARSR